MTHDCLPHQVHLEELAQRGPRNASAKETFARFDTDADGYLDLQELHMALEHHGLHLSTAEAGRRLAAYGAQHDARLELSEFKKVLQDLSAASSTDLRTISLPVAAFVERRVEDTCVPGFYYNLEVSRAAAREQAQGHQGRTERARSLPHAELEKYRWVPLLSAHTRPDAAGLHAIYRHDELATDEVKISEVKIGHRRTTKHLPVVPASVVTLAYVDAPPSAYSEVLGGFFRRVARDDGRGASSGDGARGKMASPSAVPSALHASDLEFVPVLHAHAVREEGTDPWHDEAELEDNEDDEDLAAAHPTVRVSSVLGEVEWKPRRRPLPSLVRLYYPFEEPRGHVAPSDVCRHLEVAVQLMELDQEGGGRGRGWRRRGRMGRAK